MNVVVSNSFSSFNPRAFLTCVLVWFVAIVCPNSETVKIFAFSLKEWIWLIYSASVAFLAVPNLVDISQCLIIISMGLSLSCVIMGLNAKVGEKLSEVEQISLQSMWITFSLSLCIRSNQLTAASYYSESQRLDQLAEMARAMDQHTMILLLSILCFFLSLFVFTTWSIYSSVFGLNKTYTVKFVFYALAVAGLTAVAGVNLHWNRRFRNFRNQWLLVILVSGRIGVFCARGLIFNC